MSTLIQLLDSDHGEAAEPVISFYSDVTPPSEARVTYEVPRNEQEEKGIAFVSGWVERTEITYRGDTVLVEVYLKDFHVENAD